MARPPITAPPNTRWLPGGRSTARHATSVVLCVAAVATLRSSLSLWPVGNVRAPKPEVKELNLQGGSREPAPRGSCAAATAAGIAAFESVATSWQNSIEKGYLIPNLGQSANKAMRDALRAFDSEAAAGGATCSRERVTLESAIREQTDRFASATLVLAESVIAQEFRAKLVKEMQKRRAPLRVREKMTLLREAVASYQRESQRTRPDWVSSAPTVTDEEAERRLGKLQFEIEESGEGQSLQRIWAHKESKKLLSERAHGVAVSLDPALRVMVRPEGIGSFQVYSEGPVGPPNNPAKLNIGILNDGSIADIYREHPVPPMFEVQPAVKVNVDVR